MLETGNWTINRRRSYVNYLNWSAKECVQETERERAREWVCVRQREGDKMALRLRRDVQKASYYVWFLGAEEAKGLRGARVINSVLPYLVDRSRGQEPLKVTLQVSHKGIKIVQVSETRPALHCAHYNWQLLLPPVPAHTHVWYLGIVEAFNTTQCHNQLRANRRHRRLCAAPIQSGNQVPPPCARLPLRLGDNGGGVASTIADPDQSTRQSKAIRGARNEVSIGKLT